MDPKPALKRLRALLPFMVAYQPLALSLLGRVLLHAALVGVVAGLVGSLFFYAIEGAERLILEGIGGYSALRAAGEKVVEGSETHQLRPGILWLLPGLGALVAGFISKRAPEVQGGGADATIQAFHRYNGVIRRRVPLLKSLATFATLSTGGSGGREGPTIQIGGALGSIIGRYLRVSPRERRILLVAGAAAGMAAVFRTPLGAALLAVEVLHRDDFETDALVPSVLASVVSYSIFTSFFGEATLFAHATHYPFVARHLPLYVLLAVIISVVASLFLACLEGVSRLCRALPIPAWVRPAVGGLALGVIITPILVFVAPRFGFDKGLGILGSGYGAAQLAITGGDFLVGWNGVKLLMLLALLKIGATSVTVGSGGSAGDFGPSLVIGGLVGGAFGRAASLLLGDPQINAGAFALVGMGTFYGGLAHVPLASLVMVCELAGSYDLLVPLMLCGGIAYVALRHRSLYPVQPPTRRESPAHRDELILDVLRGVRVKEVLKREHPYRSFTVSTPAKEVIARIDEADSQDTFPVVSEERKLVGVVTSDIHRRIAHAPELADAPNAQGLMRKAPCVHEDSDLHAALEKFLEHRVRELVVVNASGKIVGFLDEAEITQAYHALTLEGQKAQAELRPIPVTHQTHP